MTQSSAVNIPFAELPGHRFRGNLREMRADPLALYAGAQKKLGDFIRVSAVRGIHCYLLTHPDAVEHVLYTHHQNYRKPDMFNRSVGLLVGKGLFTNEGESWLSQRRLAQPGVHSQSLAQLGPQIVSAAEDFVRAQEGTAGQPLDIAAAMMKLGLRIASTTLFSADISGEADAVGRAFRTGFTHISKRMNSTQLIPAWLPTPANLRFARAKRVLDRVVLELIAAHRSAAVPPADFLSMLMNAKEAETGRGMPDRLLMDEVITLLTAGHENIGSALTWSLYLLARHPEVQEELYAEIFGSLGSRAPAFEDVGHLALVRAAFEEGMRIYPPGWGELRESIGPDVICGRALPAKAIVILCQWVTHRHPEFWPEPERFDPVRFLPAQAKGRHRFAYFPFGGGPRVCIGMQLAIVEGVLVLATLLQHFRIALVPGQLIVPDATFTLRPRHGLKVTLTRRSA